MGTGSILSIATQTLHYLDASPTLSGVASGTISGLISVFVAYWIATKWFAWYMRPSFVLDIRDTTDDTGSKYKTLFVTSKRQGFDGGRVYFLMLIEKSRFLELERKQRSSNGTQLKIFNRGRGYDPFIIDQKEEKNVLKKPYTKLSMTITENLYPDSPVPLLMFKVEETPLEIYYLIRTEKGSFPKNGSPKITETGKLPRMKIY